MPKTALLFFDDWSLENRTNLERHIGQPEFVPEGTWEDPHTDIQWGYPTVFQDPHTGTWRCVYQGRLPNRQFVPLVAESEDGVHWYLPDLTERIPLADRAVPHQLFSVDGFDEWSGPYLDPRAEGTDAWLKGLVIDHSEYEGVLVSRLFTSPDGLHWSHQKDVEWQMTAGDPAATAFWNPYRNTHVIVSRPRNNDRRIAVHETADWTTFTDPELALQADALDTPCAEIYGMPVIPYEHMFIGMLWIFHTDPTVNSVNKYLMGKVDCQLAYSHNGWHFQRTVRESFLRPAPGNHGSGCIYPYAIVPHGDNLRLYSSTARGEHAQAQDTSEGPELRNSAIVLHTLRRDGFVYLEPEGGSGELTTRPLRWERGEPELNITAPGGQVRVQVCDADGEPLEGYRFADCLPFEGESVAWIPRWRDGRSVDALRDRIVRLQVRLANSRIYAIRGDFAMQFAHQARLFTAHGQKFEPQPGF